MKKNFLFFLSFLPVISLAQDLYDVEGVDAEVEMNELSHTYPCLPGVVYPGPHVPLPHPYPSYPYYPYPYYPYPTYPTDPHYSEHENCANEFKLEDRGAGYTSCYKYKGKWSSRQNQCVWDKGTWTERDNCL